MLLRFFERRRRRRFLKEATPADWSPHLVALPFAETLSPAEVRRLIGLAGNFEREVAFAGQDGLRLDERIVRAISLQACRLILNLGTSCYSHVREVHVYPEPFHALAGEANQPVRAAGLAVPDGRVLLAWDHVELGAACDRDGRNVVYHEFAHKLDLLDGFLDGIPAIGAEARYRSWQRIVGREHRRLRRALKRNRPTLIHAYGATNEVEFFAEATEVFFERARELKRQHPRLYRALRRFYSQDPAR